MSFFFYLDRVDPGSSNAGDRPVLVLLKIRLDHMLLRHCPHFLKCVNDFVLFDYIYIHNYLI